MDNRDFAGFMVDAYQKVVDACAESKADIIRDIASGVMLLAVSFATVAQCYQKVVEVEGGSWWWVLLAVCVLLCVLFACGVRKGVQHWGYLYHIEEMLQDAFLDHQIHGNFEKFRSSVGRAASRLRRQLKVEVIISMPLAAKSFCGVDPARRMRKVSSADQDNVNMVLARQQARNSRRVSTGHGVSKGGVNEPPTTPRPASPPPPVSPRGSQVQPSTTAVQGPEK